MNSMDLCYRCLCIADARSSFDARSKDGEILGSFAAASLAMRIAAWVERMGQQDPDVRFSLDEDTGALIPVTTWYGDKVCQLHLWYLVGLERTRNAVRPKY